MGLEIYVNGEYMDRDAPCISIFDHGLLYGDGIFEGIRAYNKRIFKFDEHMDRLYNSAKAIDMEIPIEKEEFKKVIIDLCRRNEIDNGYMRPIVTRGKGDLGLDPRRCKGATIAIIAQPFDPLYGDAYEKGLKVITTSWRRNPPQCVNPNIKSLNYLNNVLARIEANQANADEALFLDNEGYVSEASADNFFIILNDVVKRLEDPDKEVHVVRRVRCTGMLHHGNGRGDRPGSGRGRKVDRQREAWSDDIGAHEGLQRPGEQHGNAHIRMRVRA
jgi:branched-chain amino acid aminotransferase